MVTKSSSGSDSTIVTTTSLQGLTIILLLLSLIANVISVLLLSGFSFPFGFGKNQEDNTIGIKRALLDLEYEKVGGKKNYDILQKYSQMQIKEQIGQIESFVNNPETAKNPTPTAPTATANAEALSQDEIAKILEGAYIEGSKDATILVVEYSEMECPFCAQQYHDTQVRKQVLEKYGAQVKFSYKNNKGVNHPGTEAKALGLLCAGKVGGESAYTKFLTYVMDNTTLRPQKRDGSVISVADLSKAATAAGVDVAKWQACVDKKETQDRFTAETAEANRFGLGGTPGTLILNTKTGKYKTIEGAYPYETFSAAIDELMK